MQQSILRFRSFVRCDAEEVVSWRYPAPYEIYNVSAGESEGMVDSMLRSELRYFAVLDEEERMIAFRCFGADAQVAGGDYSGDALDMGGGLRPDLTGQGLGRYVVCAAMKFAIRRFCPVLFRTTVASFNGRARRVCESLGYQVKSEFVRPTDQMQFLILMRDAVEVDLEAEERQPNPESLDVAKPTS